MKKSNNKRKRVRKTTRKQTSKQKRTVELWTKFGFLLLLVISIGLLVFRCSMKTTRTSHLKVDASEPEIDVQLLDVNDYSRPGMESDPITGIVIHYTANPGSTAQNNRDYFNGLQDGHGESVSSHFVVGMDGEIVQCVPTWEIAYASNDRNHDTVSIECCHPDESGKFTKETYKSVVQLTAFLCKKYDLTEKDVIRHYDVTGKNCPKYFVENEEAWDVFRADVAAALKASE